MGLNRKPLSFFTFTLACFSSGLGQGLDTTSYFPLAIGNRYTYYQSLPCPPDTVRQRIGPWGGNLVRDTTIIDGKKYFITLVAMLELGSDTTRVDSAGNMLIRRRGLEQVFYKFHAAVGDTWSYVAEIGGREYRYRATLQSRSDIVKVHAGTFTNCLRFLFDVPGWVDEEFTHWLAPGVGLVFRCVQEPLELYEATVGGIHYPILVSVERDQNPIVSFVLYQNYPNPFNPVTVIEYSIKDPGPASLAVYNMLGQKVADLVNESNHSSGTFSISFDASRLSSGVYFYALRSTGHLEVRKMVVMR